MVIDVIVISEKSKECKRKREDELYDDSEETNSITVAQNGELTFCIHFKTPIVTDDNNLSSPPQLTLLRNRILSIKMI